ncbi:PREDICTED: orexin receptor type 2-like [Priapulus caudatus]|uniref:Orexin receptor type 2-like n=1 Tax=Priapulus caudatus TaxID=37621 RepID=A0ABM1DY97_PRICU|nr:PREDICTED: orexin receptor type 2-like [Priapulus caudatus]
MSASQPYDDVNVTAWDDIRREFEESLLTIKEPTTLALIVIYTLLFVMSLVGNVSVCVVVWRNHYMRKAKNYFLMNLSLADLLVTLICVPIILGSTLYRKWVYGVAMCKLAWFFQGVAVAASILSLTALSLDRYLAVKHPELFRRISNHKNGIKLLGLIWLVSAIFMMPLLYVRRVFEESLPEFGIQISFCVESWSSEASKQAFAIFMLIVVYSAPCSVIVYCHYVVCSTLSATTNVSRQDSDTSGGCGNKVSRRSIARMLIALVTCFVVCWLPYNICSLWFDLQQTSLGVQVLPFTLLLAHANSACNPILFWLLNNHFRNGINGIICCGGSSIYSPKHANATNMRSPPRIVIHHAPSIRTRDTNRRTKPLIPANAV